MPKQPRSLEFYKAWGSVGGTKRGRKLSASRRKEIARAAANARWHPSNKTKPIKG